MNDVNALTCKGCYSLGTACGKCARCKQEVEELLGRGVIDQQTHEAAVAFFAKLNKPPLRRSIIGRAKREQTAILVVAYLRRTMCVPHGPVNADLVLYERQQQVRFSGESSVEFQIIVADDLDRVNGKVDIQYTNNWVDVCRAFITGAGDYW